MFTAKKLEDGINWVQAASSVQMEVNTAISGPRGKCPWHILPGFDPKLGSTPLPILNLSFPTQTKDSMRLQKTLPKPRSSKHIKPTKREEHPRPTLLDPKLCCQQRTSQPDTTSPNYPLNG